MNELAFRGEFSQEYELWLLNSTSEHELNKVICENEGCGCWKLVRNTFHKDIFVCAFKICAWDYSSGDVLNHQATFFSHLVLPCKDKGKHFIFLQESVFPMRRWQVFSWRFLRNGQLHFWEKAGVDFFHLKSKLWALACFTLWLDRWPEEWRVRGSIPGEDTYLPCGLDPQPWSGGNRGNQLMYVSLSHPHPCFSFYIPHTSPLHSLSLK